jgi:hypothetical protein
VAVCLNRDSYKANIVPALSAFLPATFSQRLSLLACRLSV